MGDAHERVHRGGQRSAVGSDVRFDLEFVALEQDGAAVAANVAGDDDAVAGLCAGAAHVHVVRDDADAGGRDEHAVDLAFAGYLGVACDDLHADLLAGLRHALDDALEPCGLEPFLDDEPAGEVQGLRAHAGDVVDRAADGQLADVPAGEFRGGHDEPVGGHGEASLRTGQHRGIVRRQQVVVKIFLEQAPDEFVGLPTAGSVSQSNGLIHSGVPRLMVQSMLYI